MLKILNVQSTQNSFKRTPLIVEVFELLLPKVYCYLNKSPTIHRWVRSFLDAISE